MRIFLLGTLFGLLCASGALALHGHWTDHYTDATGSPCCGKRDCLQTPLRILTADATTITLEIAGQVVQIPQRIFYTSEDMHDWWCAKNPTQPPSTENTRCVFLAIGS